MEEESPVAEKGVGAWSGRIVEVGVGPVLAEGVGGVGP